MHFTRVVRADKKRPGLLYAGTEYGMYISFNDGASWKPFQLNLPVVPVTDLTIKENDLIVATQGRSFYILDDLSMLQKMNPAITTKRVYVFEIPPVYRMQDNPFSAAFGTPRNAGTNPPPGVVINYYVRNIPDSAKASVSFFDNKHNLIRTFTTDAKDTNSKMEVAKGMNQFVWKLQYPEAERIEGMVLWNGVPDAILTPPGNYFARIKVENDSAEVPFTVKADPNFKAEQAEYEEQFRFLTQIPDKFNETQKAIKDIRTLRSQINEFTTRQGKDIPKELKTMADSINKRLTAIEETLYQTKAKSSQDVLNYPIKLNDKLAGVFNVAASGNFAPSRQVQEVYNDLAAQVDVQLAKLRTIKERDVPSFNELIRQKALPVIGVK